MTVDIQASFSKKEKPRNGLEDIVKDLTGDPLTRRYVIGVIECPTTKVDNLKGGALTPVVRFVYIEPMISQSEEDAARTLFERAYKARIGTLPPEELPLEGQDQLPIDEGDGDE
jgi:hypothetical protein